MALTFTQDDLNALKEAYLTGATSVRIGDRQINYRSQKELLQAIEKIQAYLDGEDPATAESTKMIKGSYSKGEI